MIFKCLTAISALLLTVSLTAQAAILPQSQSAGISPIHPQAVVKLAVIAGSMTFNRHNVAHASMAQDANGKPVVNVVLTDEGAAQLNALVAHQMGKDAMITWNKTVISVAKLQSPLGDSFQLAGFSPAQAQAFVEGVRKSKPQLKG